MIFIFIFSVSCVHVPWDVQSDFEVHFFRSHLVFKAIKIIYWRGGKMQNERIGR